MKRKIRTFSGRKNPAITKTELAHRALSRQAATEGMVLLKNENILPLKKEAPVALFGKGAGQTVKGGVGSGDVCVREVVSIFEGMEAAGVNITSKDWVIDYNRRYQQAREDWKAELSVEGKDRIINLYERHVFKAPAGLPIEKKYVQNTDTAIYVISRIAGEGADRQVIEGDYLLTSDEIHDLEILAKMGLNIIVLLNTGSIIDLSPILENTSIKAILYMCQPGMEAGHAVCDLLFGDQNPSGKLTDTWPLSYQDVPSADTFSYRNGNIQEERYEDGIHVGYRYYDSFDVKPAFCFGYGLSYTTFDIKQDESLMTIDGNQVTITVPVKNTGKCAGKEVVQIYAVCPQNTLPKEHRRLVGYAKTGLLACEEMEELSIPFTARDLASYYEESNCWKVDAGRYYLMAGNSLEDAEVIASLLVEEDVILEEVQSICPLEEELIELMIPEDLAKKKYDKVAEIASDKACQEMVFCPVKESLRVPENAERYQHYTKMARELVEQLTVDELIAMSVGEINRGQDTSLGAAGSMVPGAAGETSRILEEKYDVPGLVMADGPAGIRVLKEYLAEEETGRIYTQGFLAAIENGFLADPLVEREGCAKYYQYATAFPVGTMMAQTFNTELVEKVGQTIGEELEAFQIAWWLAPGMNIHRNPLCGRNFEYYSEDPLVAGKTAAAITRGIQSNPGIGTTIKHFVCNNLEDNRFGNNSILSERALREVYLRGFEIAVKEAQPMALMSSYNLVNGVHTANQKDLLLTLLREEWGFLGVVMTDWTTTANGSEAWKCPAAGNDLIMPGTDDDMENIRQALEDGRLSLEELKDSVCRLLTVIYQTLGYEEAECYDYL